MGAITLGQDHQLGAVEIDPGVVDMIRILIRHDTAGAEEHLPTLRVHMLNAADHPISTGDLILHRALTGIVKVEVIPAVAFRHPDQLPSIVQAMQETFAGVIDEGGTLFVHDSPRFTRVRFHGNHAQHLVAPLVVKELNLRRVRCPVNLAETPRIGKQCVVNRDLAAAGHIKQVRFRLRYRVARLGILEGMELGLELIFG